MRKMETKTEFYCSECDKKFRAKKTKLESLHPIYGACWKNIAYCPDCKEVCDEHNERVVVKSSSEGECCREKAGGHKHSGCCCCN